MRLSLSIALIAFAGLGTSACVYNSAYSNVDLGGSVIVLSRARAVADDNDLIDVAVVLRRNSGRPVEGLHVALDAGVCNATQQGASSDPNGVVLGAVRSGAATRCTLQVIVSQGDFTWALPQAPTLDFYALPTLATHLALLPVQAAIAGVPLSVTVLALDAQGAADANFMGTVRLRSDDPNAVMPAPFAMRVGDHGAHTFDAVQLQRAGATQLSATADGSGISAGNAGLAVLGGTAVRLAFAQLPEQVTAGASIAAQVVALDAFGNFASGYGAQAAVTSDDAGATVSTAVFDANAVGAFTQTLLHTGSHTLTATDTSATPLTVRSAPVLVQPARATALVVDAPAHASATLPMALTVRAADPYGNTDPLFAGTVHLTSSDGASTLPVDYAFTAADAGSHAFIPGATLATTGNQTVTASSGPLPAASAKIQVFNVLRIASGNGAAHTCAILSDLTVKCWGANSQGQLGLGDVVDRGTNSAGLGANLPAVSLGTGRTAVQLSLSATSTCAVLDDQSLKCWGLNNSGQLGLGDTRNRGYIPGQMGDALPAVALRAPSAFVNAIDGDTYVVSSAGSMQSWGYSYQCMQLGSGVCGNFVALPTDVFLPSATAVEVAAGVWTASVRLQSGDVVSWGDGWTGQLGRGSYAHDAYAGAPIDLGSGRTALAITAQAYAYCALLDDHSVKCWGEGYGGALGLGDSTYRGSNNDMGDALPPVNLGSGRTARAVQGLTVGACALLDTGAVKCWGDNTHGVLGVGDSTQRGDTPASLGDNLPAVNLGAGRTARQLAAGAGFVCALLDNNLVRCWGDNQVGNLGVGDVQARGDQPGSLGDALPYVQLW